MKEVTYSKKSPPRTLCILIMCGGIIIMPTNGYTSTAASKVKYIERVKMGEVIAIDVAKKQLTINASTTLIIGECDSHTLFFLGSGKEVAISDISVGQVVYLFGIVSSTSTDMKIQKVVLRNSSRLSRKTSTTSAAVSQPFAAEMRKSLVTAQAEMSQDIKELLRTLFSGTLRTVKQT